MHHPSSWLYFVENVFTGVLCMCTLAKRCKLDILTGEAIPQLKIKVVQVKSGTDRVAVKTYHELILWIHQ